MKDIDHIQSLHYLEKSVPSFATVPPVVSVPEKIVPSSVQNDTSVLGTILSPVSAVVSGISTVSTGIANVVTSGSINKSEVVEDNEKSEDDTKEPFTFLSILGSRFQKKKVKSTPDVLTVASEVVVLSDPTSLRRIGLKII